ncbi:hypothetical protein SAMN05421640_2725 [Ekhidna lutea]|uniref:DUF3244 domain-containing protein n=1 Tax=Ekhidna lutea TaxID=447679 RepID=A0A239KLJ5_EKHLU|nr:hypothetical protein [Ekhidna lutea]SNT18592.1 hypothetical protein SAMN05421640_2725 [Ekhidna lutea]
MLKLTLLLAFILIGSPVKNEKKDATSSIPSIEFSNPAIEFESGQPVFTKETVATLNKPDSEEVRISINDDVDVSVSSTQIELSSLINLSEGTYTILVQGKNYEETFGFTIK